MQAQPEGRGHPWEVRLFMALPAAPMVLGALISAVAITASYLYHELAVGIPVWDPEAGGIVPLAEAASSSLLASVLVGYVFGAFGQAALALRRDLVELGVQDTDSPLDSLESDLTSSRTFGVLGIVVMLVVTVGMKTAFSTPLTWESIDAYVPLLLLQTANGWLVGRVSYFAFSMTPVLRALTERGEIDLLDLASTRVLGRIALRNSLLFIIGIALMIPWMLALPFMIHAFVALIALTMIIPVLLLVLPTRGVSLRIRAAKAAALKQLEGELRRAREAAVPSESGRPGRLADLLAYRAYVVSIPDWPFDSPTLFRFALYMLIPLASWVGSAFVERVVNTALD